MARKFTTEERTFIVERWWYHHENPQNVVQDFAARFPGPRPPRSRQAIQNLVMRFRTHGTVADSPRSGRPRTEFTDENKELTAQSSVESPRLSTRNRARQLGVSQTGVRRFLKALHFRVYRPRLLHALHPEDRGHRTQFCETFLIRHEADPKFLTNIV